MSTSDIVVVGGGPNGLMMACELGLAGIRPIVLERLSVRTTENRANGLVGQVVRMLDRRGLYERLGDFPQPQPTQFYVFGALPLDLRSMADSPLYTVGVPQRRVEQVLEERAIELGAEIRRGHELTGLTQDADGVTVDIAGPTGPYQMRARYLVGADGAHSITRKLAGIGFPGVTKDNAVSRTANTSVPSSVIDSATGGLNLPGYGVIPPFLHHRTERGVFVFAPFPAGQLMNTVEWAEGATEKPMTLEELRESVRRVLGVDVPIDEPEGEGPHLLRRLAGGNTRLADRFRDGRVFLVGDAAHVHSGIGGPGLNLGLQDAVNLGWKLAAALLGKLPPTVLDSYETERRPAAERVIMHTQAQSALIAPGSDVTALRELFQELLRDQHNVRHIADLMAGADLHYDMGNGDTGNDGALPIGRWAPDLELHTADGPVRLAELTRSARPLLLDLTKNGDLSGYGDQVDVITARASDAPASMLLRPDCYIAWASTSPQPDAQERSSLHAAVQRWCDATTTRGVAGSAAS